MSDLISRKALLEEAEYDENYRLIVPIEKIKHAPTAYNVDKVINQLSTKMFSAELYGDEWNGQTVNNLLCMGDVYEIVKGEIKDD